MEILIEPKFIYSCDHNLIDYGEKSKTIKILKNPKSIEGTVTSDVFIVGGTLKSIDRVYSPVSKKSANRFCCKDSNAGCLYKEGVDFSITVNSAGNRIEINWLDNAPPDNEYFYVDVTYDAMMDTEIKCDSVSFLHSGKIDVIYSIPSNANLIFVKGKNGMYVENRDYSSCIKFDSGASAKYNLYIEWNVDIDETELTAIYYVSYDTIHDPKFLMVNYMIRTRMICQKAQWLIMMMKMLCL